MFKQIILLLSIISTLSSCASSKDEFYNKGLWDKYSKKTSTSSKLHSKLVEVHNRDSLAFNYTPYGADFK